MAWTSPRTWVAGEKPSAATMNTHIRDNLKAIGDAWTAYTPTFSGTLGNGTLTGAYVAAGKLTLFRFTLTAGSTTVFGANWTISLPVAAITATATPSVGQGVGFDTSAAAYRPAALRLATTTTVDFLLSDGTRFGAAVPWTWATGDTLAAYGAYQAA